MIRASIRVSALLAFVGMASPSLATADGPDHPVVAGFERFYADPASDGVRGGLLLLGELNCTSCHKAGAAEGQILAKKAPILDGVGGRVKVAAIRGFLADPHKAKPGTTMPHVLAGLEGKDREEAVEALVHFLASTGSVVQGRADRKVIADGRALYTQVGCLACHGAVEGGSPPLATSVPLPDLAAKYTLPSLTAFLANPHKSRPSGRMPSLNLDAKDSAAMANYLLRGASSDTKPNLRYQSYVGEWDKLPDFATLTPKSSGESLGFDLRVVNEHNGFALRFEGFLHVDREDDYTLFVTSDDGSKIWIDDKQVAESDGTHPSQTGAGRVHLTAGTHKVVVGYFDAAGETDLAVEIESPNLPRQPLDPYVSLTDRPAKPEEKSDHFTFNPELADKGRKLFATVGCASCHELNRDKKPIASGLAAADLMALNRNAGCLAANPPKNAMHYGLNERQRGAISGALAWLSLSPPKADVKEAIARTMTAFNCYACHARDGMGGVEEARNASFVATYADLGDEGRLPPALNGVGAKLKEEWFNHIFTDGAKDRPYMKARMPRFGAANVGHLTAAYAAVDSLPAAPPVELGQAERRVKAIGRHLVGTQAFGCVQCHNFKGEKSNGIPALDMTIMTRRLKHDWFVQYVVNPAAFRPGTRMPSAWPGPRSQLADILDGSSQKQIEAVWDYLSDGPSANTPVGIGRLPIPLVAEKEAVIYRNFIQGAGPRAIGVGYPEKANIAYDANTGRIALMWQGAFMDASKHWSGRGEGFQPPMGDNVVKLPGGPSLAILKDEKAAWPTGPRAENGFQFKGYKLGKDRKPVFSFVLGPIQVDDMPDAIANKEAAGLKRTLTITSGSNTDNLWYRAAVGRKIEAGVDGWYAIDGDYKTKVEADAKPVVRQSDGKVELLVPVKVTNGSTKLTQHYQW